MTENSTKLTLREKVCYGLGDVSNGLAVSSVAFFILKYLTDVAGLSAQAAGIAIMIGRVWDAVTDPLMGWITDHTNSRWGKRRVYLLFGAVPYAASYAALWMVPAFEKEVLIFAYVTVCLLVFNTFLTIVFVPYTSLTAAITNDYDERTSLTGYRMVASQSSFLLGAVVPSALVVWVTTPAGMEFLSNIGLGEIFGAWTGTQRQGYFLMATFFSFIMVASILTTFFGTKERDLEGPQILHKKSSSTPMDYAYSIVEELQINRPFQTAALLFLLTNCAATFVAVNLTYLIDNVLNLRHVQWKIFLCLFLCAIAAMPFWVLIAKRFGKAETYRAAMACYVVVLCGMPFLEEGNATMAYLLACAAGVFHAAALLLPWAIIPDVVEHDELKNGRRREGLFYGGTTFTYKMATGLAVMLSGFALDFIGYVPNQVQTDSAIFGIKALVGPVPALLLVAGAMLSLRYPLTQEAHHLIVVALRERRARERLE